MSLIGNYPPKYESRITLKNGRELRLRPIQQTDETLLVDLFGKLSVQSIYMRFLRHLHALPIDMLYRFTHIDYTSEFALAGVIEEDSKDVIIAIARYAHNPDDTHTELAVAVRDDWQHIGLGKAMLKRVVEIGKEHGIYSFGGMIDPQNRIIMQTLVELGYKVNYSLKSGYYEVEILV